MSNQTILYKLDAANKVREWCCWTEDNTLIIRFGLLNGQKVFERTELSSPQRAEEEAKRCIRKQQERKGYTSHIPTSRELRPMLAHRFQEHSSKLPELVIIQPKLNGYRCLGTKFRMETRTTLSLPSFPQVQHCLNMLPEDIILDGELYNHNTRFQSIMKSRTSIPTKDSLFTEYHVFDCVEDMPYIKRRVLLSEVIMELMDKYQKNPFIAYDQPIPFPLQTVPSTSAKVTDAAKYLDKYLSERYEGIMLRDPQAHYEIDVRSYSLQKYKLRESDYFKIVDIIPAPRRSKEGLMVCIMPNGVTFKSAIKGSQVQREMALRYPMNYIGKFAFVEYAEISVDGKPIQGVGRLQDV